MPVIRVKYDEQTSRGSNVVTKSIEADNVESSNALIPVVKFFNHGQQVETLAKDHIVDVESSDGGLLGIIARAIGKII